MGIIHHTIVEKRVSFRHNIIMWKISVVSLFSEIAQTKFVFFSVLAVQTKLSFASDIHPFLY